MSHPNTLPAAQVPGEAGNIVAFVDIGTNSVRLLLVRIRPDLTYTILSDQKEIVRLGEGEFIDQNLQPEAMERAVLVCHKFADMARSAGVQEIVAVATSATREAENRTEFLARLQGEAGLDVHTISGREEARLIYLGIVNTIHLGEKTALFIDIGGGSTEITVGNQREYQHLDSLKLGAIRLTALFFLPGEAGPVEPARYALLQQYVRNLAVRAQQQVSRYSIDSSYGSSGTIENLADIAVRMFAGRERQRDDVLTHEQLRKVVQHLCSLPLVKRREVPGINPSRADIIIAGAAIIDTLMEEIGLSQIHVSDRGLRDGLLMDYLARSEHGSLLQEMTVRERSVIQLGRACGFDEKHARTVARLAVELFDSGRETKLHDLGEKEREYLGHAALLHDIGAFLSYSNHQQHSYYLIRNADLLGFDQTEIEIIAATALFHRKNFPRAKNNPEYAGLDKDSRKTVRLLASLLRLAEALDRSHAGHIRHAHLARKNKQATILELEAEGDCQLELWGVENQKTSLERALGREFEVEVVRGTE